MATATTNKLPEFATEPQDNTFDEEIIDKSSELEETGFVPNTTIRSSQMNTYMKMMIESLRGIVDGLYRQAAAQGEIKADSTAQEWQDYIQKGLTDLITKTKVNNAVHADEATNVDAITNNDNGNNANVKFSIGDKSFSKTVNNVANANACSGNAASATKLQNARTVNISGDATGTAQSFDGTANITIPIDVKKSAALDSTNIGDATHPVYFDSTGKPVRIATVAEANHAVNADNSTEATHADNADVAIEAGKLSNARNITLAGDATGSASFDGSANATITVDVKTAAALDSKSIGSSTNPVYIDADGKPQATGSSLAKSITGNAGTATKLQTPRNIALTGDVVGNANFDGSGNIEIETSTTIENAKAMVDATGNPLNVGSSLKPVYFSNGVPTEVNQYDKIVFTNQTVNTSGNISFDVDDIPDKSHFFAMITINTNHNLGGRFLGPLFVEFNEGKLVLDDTFQNGVSCVNIDDISSNASFTIYNTTLDRYTTTAYQNQAFFLLISRLSYSSADKAFSFSYFSGNNVDITITKLYQID